MTGSNGQSESSAQGSPRATAEVGPDESFEVVASEDASLAVLGPPSPSTSDVFALAASLQDERERPAAEAAAEHEAADDGQSPSALTGEPDQVETVETADRSPVFVHLTGSSEGADDPSDEKRSSDWFRHPNGRWIVGDAGRQAEVQDTPAERGKYRSDITVDGAQLGSLTFRAVSLRGLGHYEQGKPRQDAYALGFTRDRRWLVGCVADGVSSGGLSHEAADIACREITDTLGGGFSTLDIGEGEGDWADLLTLPWQQAVDGASQAIVDSATDTYRAIFERQGNHERVAELDEGPLPPAAASQLMATTAVAFVVATKSDSSGRLPYALAVAAGDSSALILSEGSWHPITDVKNLDSEIASSAVRPLPRQVDVQPFWGFLSPGQALAVITDGIGDPLGTGQGLVGRFLASMWQEPPDHFEFAGHAAFYRKTFTDDRTAVVVWAPQPHDRD